MQKILLTLCVLGLFLSPGRCSCAAELIVNGDFESGNTGFTSGYVYSPADMSSAGVYSIETSPRNVHYAWAPYGDHTTGSGRMMVVNGATSPDTLVWGETIKVAPNSRYQFSAWASSAYEANTANFDLTFNGGTPIHFDAPTTVGAWQQFTALWDSGSASSLTIRLIDRNGQAGGNDFALDDISLTGSSAVPEPSTLVRWSSLGLAGVVFALYRRRRRPA